MQVLCTINATTLHPSTCLSCRARPEVMTIGIKTVRELCTRCPLIMTPELLQVGAGGGASQGRAGLGMVTV